MVNRILLASFLLSGIASAMPRGMALVPKGRFTLPFSMDTVAVRMKVDAFYLDRFEVTHSGFRDFVAANPKQARSRMKPMFADAAYLADWKSDSAPPPGLGNSPVTKVSWYAAKAYCSSQGKRLPTTVEWEWAAKALPPGMDSAGLDRAILDWYAKPAGVRRNPVGTGSVNGYGIRDLYGLVWEWTSDFDAFGFTGVNQGGQADSAYFCGAAGTAAAKQAGYSTYMRWAFRRSLRADYSVGSLGFRCARSLEGNEER